MKKIKINSHFIIQLCSILMFLVSFAFLAQTFVSSSNILGSSQLKLSGYRTLLGTAIEVKLMTYPETYVTEILHGHPLTIFAFVILLIGLVLQNVLIVLRILKKTPIKIIAIINLVSSIFTIIAGIITIFSTKLFNLANGFSGTLEYSSVGVATSATSTIMCGLITILNSYDLLLKKD